VPGIRPAGSDTHDQKRSMTSEAAIAAGAEVLVDPFARITEAPDSVAAGYRGDVGFSRLLTRRPPFSDAHRGFYPHDRAIWSMVSGLLMLFSVGLFIVEIIFAAQVTCSAGVLYSLA